MKTLRALCCACLALAISAVAGGVSAQMIDKKALSLEAVKKVAEARPKIVRLFVRRDRATAFVFVQPDWPAK